MRHILVPIDFSDHSVNALEFSVLLANYLNMDIRMVHVLKTLSTIFKVADNTTPKVDETSMLLLFDQLLEKYGPEVNSKIDYRIRRGKIYNEIANQAKYGDSGMIVIGTHGSSGFEELWLGSTAYKVINNSSCPVLSVRQSFKPRKIQKIVLPIDDTPETRQKVPFITELATRFDAEVHVLDICENNKLDLVSRIETYKAQVIEFFINHGVKIVQCSARGTNLTNMTIEYAQAVDAEIIAIMTEQNESTKNIWLGPYAQQMVNHSPIPVLSMHPY
jgi:nucleotide-binding universal stress UspA family protein